MSLGRVGSCRLWGRVGRGGRWPVGRSTSGDDLSEQVHCCVAGLGYHERGWCCGRGSWGCHCDHSVTSGRLRGTIACTCYGRNPRPPGALLGTPGGTRTPNLLIRRSPSGVHGRPHASGRAANDGLRVHWTSMRVHGRPQRMAPNLAPRAGALYGPRLDADSLTLELLGCSPTASDDRPKPLADIRLYVNPGRSGGSPHPDTTHISPTTASTGLSSRPDTSRVSSLRHIKGRSDSDRHRLFAWHANDSLH